MQQDLVERHLIDEQGNPAGGTTRGTGIDIRWQDGPLGRGEHRKLPNGAFVEGVIAAALGRLRWYQDSPFACGENRSAINRLEEALAALEQRTANRQARGVEGTHES